MHIFGKLTTPYGMFEWKKKLWPLTFRSRGLRMFVLVGFLHGAFKLMLPFDESWSSFDDVGSPSGSGVGNLMGDMFPFVRRGVNFLSVDIVDVEGDVVSDEVDGVSIGII